MAESKPPTDEYKRVLMAQAVANTKRNRTTDEIRAAVGWKGFPLTIGLLVALVLGVVFIASAVRGYQSDLATQIERAIAVHGRDSDAHQNIRAEIQKQANQTRELVGTLRNELRDSKPVRRVR